MLSLVGLFWSFLGRFSVSGGLAEAWVSKSLMLLPFFRFCFREVAVPCLGVGQILSSFSRVPWACFWLRFHSLDSWWLGWAVLCLCLPCPKFSSSVGASSFVLEARTWLVLPSSCRFELWCCFSPWSARMDCWMCLVFSAFHPLLCSRV